MTFFGILLFIVSIIDALLIMASFLIHRRILRLQMQYERMGGGS